MRFFLSGKEKQILRLICARLPQNLGYLVGPKATAKIENA